MKEEIENRRLIDAVKRYKSERTRDKLNLRAALIDMDGTLYDSMPYHAAAWRRMTAELGIDLPMEEFFRYEGRTGASTINLIFRKAKGRDATEAEQHDLYERKKELFSAMAPVAVMPGAQQMIRVFEQSGVTRVLVTGSGQSSLLDRLDTDFPGGFIEKLRVTSRDVKVGKPSAEPYLKALVMVGAEACQAMVVENAPLGVESGHSAGIFTVGVTTGPLKAEELLASGADITFDSMPEFADKLPQLIRIFNSIDTL